MSEALGDLKESCRPTKSQLPPSPPRQLSTPTGRGQRGQCEARFLLGRSREGGISSPTGSPDSGTPGEGLGF